MKKSKVKIGVTQVIERNHRMAKYEDMEDSLKCSEGQDRLMVFKNILLEMYLVVAKDVSKNTKRFMEKVVRNNRAWRMYSSKYPISESSDELDIGSAFAVECDVVDPDLYCAMLVGIRVKEDVLVSSGMCGKIHRDTIITALDWLQEVADEQFDPNDLMDGIAEELL